MAVTTQTISAQIEQVFSSMKKKVAALRTEPVKNRIQRLSSLRKWIHANRTAIHKAMHDDFSKAPLEVDAIEIFHVLNEIKLATDNLSTWARPKKVDAPITMIG